MCTAAPHYARRIEKAQAASGPGAMSAALFLSRTNALSCGQTLNERKRGDDRLLGDGKKRTDGTGNSNDSGSNKERAKAMMTAGLIGRLGELQEKPYANETRAMPIARVHK